MTRTYEQILEPLQSFLQPISPEAPAGVSAKFDASYEALRAEVMKLDSPRGEAVNWKTVHTWGTEILATKSKDLLIASHVAIAMYHERGFEGLAAGTAILTELAARYWEAVFPPLARVRARVGAFEWYLDRTALIFELIKTPGEKDRAGIQDLAVAVDKLRATVTEKLAEHAPAMTPLKDAVARLVVSLPKPPPPPPPPPAAPATADGAPAGTAPGQSSSSPAAPGDAAGAGSAATPNAAAVAAPAGAAKPEDLTKFLQACSKSLVDTAVALRQVKPTDAVAYRLLRAGMWLPVTDPPPLGGNGRTMVPALTKETRLKLDKLVETGGFAALLNEAEGALLRNRLNLDLLRYSAQAMGALDGYAAARQVCTIELRGLLDRLPGLPKLPTNDGSPLADDRTKMWLDEEVLAAPGEGGGRRGAGGPVIPEEQMTAIQKHLTGGHASQALAAFETLIAAARDGRTRAQIRLAEAEACRKAGATRIAEAIYEALDGELTMMHMEQWEPELVVECLAGRLSCMRAGKKPGEAKPDEQAVYMRLAQLKPSLALSLGA